MSSLGTITNATIISVRREASRSSEVCRSRGATGCRLSAEQQHACDAEGVGQHECADSLDFAQQVRLQCFTPIRAELVSHEPDAGATPIRVVATTSAMETKDCFTGENIGNLFCQKETIFKLSCLTAPASRARSFVLASELTQTTTRFNQ